MGVNGDPYQAPLRCRLPPANAGRRTFEVFQNAQRRFVKVTACLGQRYGTGGAVHQFGAELIFQGGDLFAHRRLPDSPLFRDGGETPFFDDPDEYLHCIELVHRAPPHSSVEWILCGRSGVKNPMVNFREKTP